MRKGLAKEIAEYSKEQCDSLMKTSIYCQAQFELIAKKDCDLKALKAAAVEVEIQKHLTKRLNTLKKAALVITEGR
jgi:hypothetical protein